MKSDMVYVGISYRFAAQLIDLIVLGIVYFIIGSAVSGSTSWSMMGGPAAAITGINLIIFLGYFTVLEGTSGSTLGKRALKMKVLKEDGGPCDIGAAFIRNILRIIDALPFLYIIGIILVARSDRKQRFGDRIAKTVVVRETAQATYIPPPPPPRGRTAEGQKFCIECGQRIPVAAEFCPKCGSKQ